MRASVVRISYDPEVDATYIYLTKTELPAGRVSISVPRDGHEELPQVILDFQGGRLVGIEVLGARDGLHSDLLRLARRR